MNKKQREQVEFILRVVTRYKSNGGVIHLLDSNHKKIRISLADFILKELSPLLQPAKTSPEPDVACVQSAKSPDLQI